MNFKFKKRVIVAIIVTCLMLFITNNVWLTKKPKVLNKNTKIEKIASQNLEQNQAKSVKGGVKDNNKTPISYKFHFQFFIIILILGFLASYKASSDHKKREEKRKNSDGVFHKNIPFIKILKKIISHYNYFTIYV